MHLHSVALPALALIVGLSTAKPLDIAKRSTSLSDPTTAGTFVNTGFCGAEPFVSGIVSRSLHGSSYVDLSAMTVESCAAYCSAYNYFAVEYGSECYCGNTPNTYTVLDTTGGCNFPCAGNPTESCGGSGRMNLYQQNALTTVLSLPTSLANIASQPNVTISGYSYYGCVTEPYVYNNTGVRGLTGGETISQAMSIESCAVICAGFNFFGLEYSEECWCGNTLDARAGIDCPGSCNMGCTGASTETCGGPSHLDLYVANGVSVPVLATTATTCSTTATSSSSSASSVNPTTITTSLGGSCGPSAATPTVCSSGLTCNTASGSTTCAATSTSTSTSSSSSTSSSTSSATPTTITTSLGASCAPSAAAPTVCSSGLSCNTAGPSTTCYGAASASAASSASVASASSASVASASSASVASASSASVASASSASVASASSAGVASASSASVASVSSASVASASSASVASASNASAASAASASASSASAASASAASASALSASVASASSASVASASSVSVASASSASVVSASSASVASASSASAVSVSSASVASAARASASSASVASASSASVASISSASAASVASVASVSSASAASVASVASASSASVASVSSASVASVASASKVQASKTSGCTTATNTAAATGQLLVNPSFEWVDSTCTETVYPWYQSVGPTTNNTYQTHDGKWYWSAYQNTAYVAQQINSTAYGTYAVSAWYRLPTAFSGSFGDTCTLAMTFDSTTLYSTKLYYGMSTVGNVSMSQLSVSGVSFTSANAGIFRIGWTCTNSAKISIDLDDISFTKS